MFKKLLLTASLLMFFVASTAYAHEEEPIVDVGFLPGNPLYFLEIISEGFGSFFTFGAVAKAERSLELAEERLLEAHALADKGEYQRAEMQVKKYEDQFKKALEKAGEVKEEALKDEAEEIVADLEELLLDISEATIEHQVVLGSIFEELSEGVQEDIEDALDVAVIGNDADINIEIEPLGVPEIDLVDFGEIGVLLEGLFDDGIFVEDLMMSPLDQEHDTLFDETLEGGLEDFDVDVFDDDIDMLEEGLSDSNEFEDMWETSELIEDGDLGGLEDLEAELKELENLNI